MEIEEKLLMTTGAARLLNRSAEAVRGYERSGKLPATKTANGHRLFRERDVRKLARELSDVAEISSATKLSEKELRTE